LSALFEIYWTDEAETIFHRLKANPSEKTRYNAVKKTLKLLSENPRHNGLQTHPFFSLAGPNGEKVFETYAQQKNPCRLPCLLVLRFKKRHQSSF